MVPARTGVTSPQCANHAYSEAPGRWRSSVLVPTPPVTENFIIPADPPGKRGRSCHEEYAHRLAWRRCACCWTGNCGAPSQRGHVHEPRLLRRPGPVRRHVRDGRLSRHVGHSHPLQLLDLHVPLLSGDGFLADTHLYGYLNSTSDTYSRVFVSSVTDERGLGTHAKPVWITETGANASLGDPAQGNEVAAEITDARNAGIFSLYYFNSGK